ncbi:hypothetical protein IVA88_14735 [Bradyrhizobium sp. 149]|uniref:hypothetical protein n=1 Tax=Bradyrhizobium sp. 149 TaxID=2782624 RepID=UPI001FF73DD7|nr:hypothetical protein [Bradyrhizobium sp. 149]MCK1652688.1 hypothetical protein [Bradyrhizobium sp. 149]
MLHINKIAKSLDERRTLLAASRRELEALLENLCAGVMLPIPVRLSAAVLDRRCSASIIESLELYEMLVIDPYILGAQVRAVANLIQAQTRLAAEHQMISAMIEKVFASGGQDCPH